MVDPIIFSSMYYRHTPAPTIIGLQVTPIVRIALTTIKINNYNQVISKLKN